MRRLPILVLLQCVALAGRVLAEPPTDAKPAGEPPAAAKADDKSAAEKPKPASGDAAQPMPAVVGWVNDRVTVRCKDTPIAAILDAIVKQSKAQLIGTPPDRKVTVEFSDLETNSALERIFGNQNFTLRYGDAGLREIVLKGEHGEEQPIAKQDDAPPAKSPSDYAPPGFWDMYKLFGDKTVSLVGTPFEKPDQKKTSWDIAIQAGYAEADKNERQKWVRVAMKAFEADKSLREGVMNTLATMSDEQLAEFVRAYLRDRGKTMLRAMLSAATYDDERERLRGVLAAVRKMDLERRAMPFGRFPKGQLH